MPGVVQEYIKSANSLRPDGWSKFRNGEFVMRVGGINIDSGKTIERPAIVERSFDVPLTVSNRPMYRITELETNAGILSNRVGEISTRSGVDESELRPLTAQEKEHHRVNLGRIAEYLVEARFEEQMEILSAKELYESGYQLATEALDKSLSKYKSPNCSTVHDIAVKFSNSIRTNENSVAYGSFNPDFNHGQRKALMAWSHKHNSELKALNISIESNRIRPRM